MSAADIRRRKWCRKHKAIVRWLKRQLTRRPPYRYEKVWCVDWMSRNEPVEIITFADWGERTRRKAIDKAISEEYALHTYAKSAAR